MVRMAKKVFTIFAIIARVAKKVFVVKAKMARKSMAKMARIKGENSGFFFRHFRHGENQEKK